MRVRGFSISREPTSPVVALHVRHLKQGRSLRISVVPPARQSSSAQAVGAFPDSWASMPRGPRRHGARHATTKEARGSELPGVASGVSRRPHAPCVLEEVLVCPGFFGCPFLDSLCAFPEPGPARSCHRSRGCRRADRWGSPARPQRLSRLPVAATWPAACVERQPPETQGFSEAAPSVLPRGVTVWDVLQRAEAPTTHENGRYSHFFVQTGASP